MGQGQYELYSETALKKKTKANQTENLLFCFKLNEVEKTRDTKQNVVK